MAVYQPTFAGANFGISFAQRAFAFPQALDFGAHQNESRFELVEKSVVIGRRAVLGDDLYAFPLVFFPFRFHVSAIIAFARKLPQPKARFLFPFPRACPIFHASCNASELKSSGN